MKNTLKVGISGVRGIVGESLTPQVSAAFAQAFGTLLGGGPVVVGRDTRASGVMIEKAIVAGLQSVGCQPILLGVVPTPTILIATALTGAQGGVAITASHNAAPWNAMKFVGSNGLFLNAARTEELTDIYHQANFSLVNESEIAEVSYMDNAIDAHVERILNYVDRERIRQKRFKVAIDCCNGVGALHSAAFLEEGLGCEIVTLLDQPTGNFEREPEPTPENLTLLSEAVVKNNCDIGFAQDPDGDRLAIVNEKGEPIGEDLTLAFAVRQVLNAHAQGSVAINLSTSKCVENVAREKGSEVVRTQIGEINVTETLLKIGAVVGGESSGGVIVPAIHPCRDSYTAMALALELMAVEEKTVSALRAEIPKFALVREKLTIRPDQASAILRALRWHYEGEKVNLLDGVYVDLDDSWIHVRRSNTEPVIRLAVEAPTLEKAQILAKDLRERVDAIIQL